MSDGACNAFFGGPAMKPHRDRVKWNVKHIIDFKTPNPHIKEEKKAYQDLWPSIRNIPVGYARLCPQKAGRVSFWSMGILGISIISNLVLLTIAII